MLSCFVVAGSEGSYCWTSGLFLKFKLCQSVSPMTFCVYLPIDYGVPLYVKYLNWMRLQWLPFTEAKVWRFDVDEQSFVAVVPQN